MYSPAKKPIENFIYSCALIGSDLCRQSNARIIVFIVFIFWSCVRNSSAAQQCNRRFLRLFLFFILFFGLLVVRCACCSQIWFVFMVFCVWVPLKNNTFILNGRTQRMHDWCTITMCGFSSLEKRNHQNHFFMIMMILDVAVAVARWCFMCALWKHLNASNGRTAFERTHRIKCDYGWEWYRNWVRETLNQNWMIPFDDNKNFYVENMK